MSWIAEMVQAVVFTTPGQPQRDSLWCWNVLYGSSPDNFSKPAGAPNSLSTAAGIVGPHQVQINVQVGRIDILLTGVGLPPPDQPQQIPDPLLALKTASELGVKLSKETSPNRIALVLRVTETVAAGNTIGRLSELLPGVTFADGTIDHIYQINKKRLLAPSEVEINRLCNWSTGMQQFFAISQEGAAFIQKAVPFISFNIDINTSGVLSPEVEYAPLWAELVDENAAFFERGHDHFKN